jgi:hypothetical protein
MGHVQQTVTHYQRVIILLVFFDVTWYHHPEYHFIIEHMMFMFFMMYLSYLIQSICSYPEVDRIWDVQRCFHSTHINVFYTLYVCIYI